MCDDRRKAVPTDLSTDSSGKDNVGALPFMALDLLSSEGRRGEISRRYRHEAESFAWSLICLYFATVEDSGGQNRTRAPHPLYRWFKDWETSRDAKIALRWRDSDVAGIPLAYPNTRMLASALHKYWVDRYDTRQFLYPHNEDDAPSLIAATFDIAESETEVPHYEEPEDGRVFLELLVRHEKALGVGPLQGTRDSLVKMSLKYKEID
jgi:hypothetical protein